MPCGYPILIILSLAWEIYMYVYAWVCVCVGVSLFDGFRSKLEIWGFCAYVCVCVCVCEYVIDDFRGTIYTWGWWRVWVFVTRWFVKNVTTKVYMVDDFHTWYVDPLYDVKEPHFFLWSSKGIRGQQKSKSEIWLPK